MNRTFKRLVMPIGAAVVIGTSGFAFMASNTLATSSAGSGTALVAGYDVTNVKYATDPDNNYVTALSFTLDKVANPSNVKATIYHAPGGTPPATVIYDDCASGDGLSFVCGPHTPGAFANLSFMDKLEIHAAQ